MRGKRLTVRGYGLTVNGLPFTVYGLLAKFMVYGLWFTEVLCKGSCAP